LNDQNLLTKMIDTTKAWNCHCVTKVVAVHPVCKRSSICDCRAVCTAVKRFSQNY
jgi:hypothetical protein